MHIGTDPSQDVHCSLVEVSSTDIDELMEWFPMQQSVVGWGGPHFRYPYTRASFHEDVRWRDMASFCLRSEAGQMLAFGQLYERIGRINLARLVVHPDWRGRGIGRKLIAALISTSRALFSLNEFSLIVYRDNARAIRCYEAMGFVIQDYPAEISLRDACYYMTRPVTAQDHGQE